ncbi:hypothetical protein NQ317_009323 [Molorchus minor]|uniref:Uncharacterized protein n=1 Tax=Molorchus minor TaxID=1323400 RepID=A0ABQ9JGK1_9CUCU|nr:hypothetical protein NQ317_009323 [Molorchus minor]
MERRLKEQEEDEEELSPEEKLRQQKESDLKIALETTFGTEKVSSGIDDFDLPNTKEEFEVFTEALTKRLTPLSKNAEYVTNVFVDRKLSRVEDEGNFLSTKTWSETEKKNYRGLILLRGRFVNSLDIKKIKNSLDNLYLEKQKIEKGDKAKKNKGKGKARLKVEEFMQAVRNCYLVVKPNRKARSFNITLSLYDPRHIIVWPQLSQLSAYVNDFDDYDDFM